MYSFPFISAENLRVYLCGTNKEEDPYINATYVHVRPLHTQPQTDNLNNCITGFVCAVYIFC